MALNPLSRKNIRLVATDLDGTILPRAGSFNALDLQALETLGEEGVIRVVATGRTFASVLEVLPPEFPIDYLVFSSGAGVFNWKTRELMQVWHLDHRQAAPVVDYLSKEGCGFTLHETIPNNHKFWYVLPNRQHADFNRFLAYHTENARPLEHQLSQDQTYCQLLAFLSESSEVQRICRDLQDVKTIRATSPIDGESVWLEFFHPEVSKASGILLICAKEEISPNQVCVLGNDYNDLDMLNRFSPNAFVVAEAPAELKERFGVVSSVYKGGLSYLINNCLPYL